jgi:preprotein translocase subunit SecG
MLMTVITYVHIITIILLIGAVLVRAGKGADISATFGGSSQTVFGSSGGQDFFQKLTYSLAAFFMLTSLLLTLIPTKLKKSVFDQYTPTATESNGAATPDNVGAEPSTAPSSPEKP